MSNQRPLRGHAARSSLLPSMAALALSCCLLAPRPATAQPAPSNLLFKVEESNDRLEMTVGTSRILTLDRDIPQAQVDNPDIVDIVPRSPTQLSILAKKAGVTQIVMWDDRNKLHTVDVLVYADARELSAILQTHFPNSTLRVTPLASSVIVWGSVDDPNKISQIIQIARDYHPSVINNINVSGAQQVLLQIKVMEISRTKLRDVGVDFANMNAAGTYVTSSVSGLIAAASNSARTVTASGSNFQFGIIDSRNSFFGIMQLLQQRNVAKILSEPQLVTISGRPAKFQVGGEFPILVPQSLGTVSIQYRQFGTQVDFVPIVLGGGAIRLEIRPRVSEIDDTRSVVINNVNVPALKVREVDTGVEMRAGQTLAIAGLVQTRVDNQIRGLPWVSDLPYVGSMFRHVKAQNNEIELLVLVTPQLVEALDPHEVPPCGPGLNTTDPNDWQLYMEGHLEVPSCGPCGHGYNCNCGGNANDELRATEPGPEGDFAPQGVEMAPEYGPGPEVVPGEEIGAPAEKGGQPIPEPKAEGAPQTRRGVGKRANSREVSSNSRRGSAPRFEGQATISDESPELDSGFELKFKPRPTNRSARRTAPKMAEVKIEDDGEGSAPPATRARAVSVSSASKTERLPGLASVSDEDDEPKAERLPPVQPSVRKAAPRPAVKSPEAARNDSRASAKVNTAPKVDQGGAKSKSATRLEPPGLIGPIGYDGRDE